MFLMTIPSRWYHEFLTCDLGRDLLPPYETTLTLSITFVPLEIGLNSYFAYVYNYII